MALSMDEQRILSEIEQHLATTEPALAARFAALSRARPRYEAPRRLVVALATALLMAAVSIAVYGLVSLRSPQPGGINSRPSGQARTPVASSRAAPTQQGAPGASASAAR